MANIEQTVEEKRINRELKIAAANLHNIAFIKLSTSGTRYFFADKNGNNVFANTDMFKKEFGFPVSEDEYAATFAIKASDANDTILLVVPKTDGLAVGKVNGIGAEEKLRKKYLEVLVSSSVAPLHVMAKRKAKAAKPQTANKKLTSK